MGTIVYSENRFCLVKEEKGHEAEDFLPFFQDMDLILVEGLKDSHYAKIEVMRRDVSKKAVCRKETVKAYVTDFRPDTWSGFDAESMSDCPVYDFHEIDAIMEIVLKEAEKFWDNRRI